MPAFRQAQHAALKLPNVGYATATDVGDPTSPYISVHPRNKKLIGKRLATALRQAGGPVALLAVREPARQRRPSDRDD